MKISKTKLIFAVSSILLLVVVLGFTAGLNIALLQKNFEESLFRSYTVSGGNIVRKIDYAVKYGKPLNNFYGMRELLEEVKRYSEEIEDVRIVLPDGNIICSLAALNGRLPAELARRVDFSKSKNQYVTTQWKNEYNMFLPIRDKNGDWIGSLCIVVDRSTIYARMNTYIKLIVKQIIFVAVLASIVLVILLFRVPLMAASGKVHEKRILVVLLSVLAASQIGFSVCNALVLNKAYIDLEYKNASTITTIMRDDIDAVLKKGIEYGELFEIEKWMDKIVQAIPEVSHIYIKSPDGKVLYKTRGMADQPQKAEGYSLMLYSGSGMMTAATLNTIISQDYITGRMREIALDAVTMLVTSILFLVEITFFLLVVLEAKYSGTAPVRAGDDAAPDTNIIRTLSFIVFMGGYMSISFIPIVMKSLCQTLPGLPESVALALPTSVEMLCCGAATLLAGLLMDKKGWRSVLIAGLAVLAAGIFLSGQAATGIMFIAARGIAGFGYGMTLISMRSCVLSAKLKEDRDRAISAMNSGAYAGVNCGVVLGGMLADRIGFSRVFMIAFAIMVLSMGFVVKFVHQRGGKAASQGAVHRAEPEDKASGGRISAFLSNSNVMVFLLLVLIPTAICGMFMDYFFPLFAQSMNVSSSDISRAFLLNGMCIIYLGPVLVRFTGRHLKGKKAVFAGAVVIAGGLVLFGLAGNVASAFIAAILLGISTSFGVAAQSNYFFSQNAVKEFGEGKALSVYTIAEKTGQMLGPMVFGGLNGIGWIGAALMLAILLFMLIKDGRIVFLHKHKPNSGWYEGG